jgi:hypothetical protein
MIILFIANFAKVDEPARWLYAAAVEFLVIDSIAVGFLYRAVAG